MTIFYIIDTYIHDYCYLVEKLFLNVLHNNNYIKLNEIDLILYTYIDISAIANS